MYWRASVHQPEIGQDFAGIVCVHQQFSTAQAAETA